MVISLSRKATSCMVMLFHLAQAPLLFHTINRWSFYWWENRSTIFLLTAINTTLTSTNEFVSRSLSESLSDSNKNNGFFVRESGSVRIHQQSLINIFMTLFASLLGGPVYFFSRTRHRFVFFLSFGLFNSVLSQQLAGLLGMGHLFFFSGPRILFDLFYMITVKFTLFEFYRPLVLKWRNRVIITSSIRISQDFFTTLLRVGLLNFFGFKG